MGNCEPETLPIGSGSGEPLNEATSLILPATEQFTGHSSKTSGEKEVSEGEDIDVVFTEANRPGRKRKREIKSSKKFKKAKKKGTRHRETLFRTKVRRQLLKAYHKLIARRKKINKAIKDNRRHRNQLIFHRDVQEKI
jgi:hypothetical protein